MTTREENDLLSHTGRGTPMGDLLRRYWLPALLSRELEADGAPVRVRLLGEDLIAFRNTEGKVGLLREHCSHRGASLYFAKNERMRAALLVSRLEIRCRRQLHRSAERAAADAVQGQGEAAGLSLHRAQRRRHDLYGSAGQEAAAARIRMADRAREPCLCLEALSGLPLAARAWKAISIRAISASCTASRR